MADNAKTWDPLEGIEDEETFAIVNAGLTDRGERFVAAYLRTRNAKRAAIEAGCPRASASNSGLTLLKDERISDLIKTLIQSRLRRLTVTPQRIETVLAMKAFGNLSNMLVIQEDGTAYIDLSSATAEDLAGIKSFSCEVELRKGEDDEGPRQVQKMKIEREDSLAALQKLMQIHKMAAGEGPTVVVDIAGEIRAARQRAGLDRGDE